jgi:hypothetical protein
MSIPALNSATDYSVYFKKYMDSLNLQDQLNKKNFDANYAYQKTGVIETERPDSRPLEERMADVEKLKVQSRIMLNKVTDAKNTDEVMDYLIKNPNIMFYFIQNFPIIQEIVKRQYSGGALSSQLISLIYKRYLQYNEEVLIPDSPDYKMVSSIMTQEDADALRKETTNSELKQAIDNAIQRLPTKAEVDKLLNNPEKYVKEIKDFANQYQDSITVDEYNTIIEAYNDRSVLRTNAQDNTLYDKELELVNRLRDFVGGDRIIDLTVEDKFIPDKNDLKQVKRTQLQKNKQQIKQEDLFLETKGSLKKTPPIKKELLKPTLQEEISKKKSLKPTMIQDDDPVFEEMAIYYNQQPNQRHLYPAELYRLLDAKRAQYLRERFLQAEADSLIAQQQQFSAFQAGVPAVDPNEELDDMPIFGSGLDKREQSIHRFKVLKGELLAGNRNRKLIKELKTLVVKMVKLNELEPSQSFSILRELNNL